MEARSTPHPLFEHLIERFGAVTFLDALGLVACERQITRQSTDVDETFLRSVERFLEAQAGAPARQG